MDCHPTFMQGGKKKDDSSAVIEGKEPQVELVIYSRRETLELVDEARFWGGSMVSSRGGSKGSSGCHRLLTSIFPMIYTIDKAGVGEGDLACSSVRLYFFSAIRNCSAVVALMSNTIDSFRHPSNHKN
ncbi:hypothetical protein ACS0TY_009169 [Phlomoides rotata]